MYSSLFSVASISFFSKSFFSKTWFILLFFATRFGRPSSFNLLFNILIDLSKISSCWVFFINLSNLVLALGVFKMELRCLFAVY